MAYITKTQYWQVKSTGLIMIISQPEDHVFAPEWHLAYRRVRLLHNPSKGEVMCEDFGTCLSFLDDPAYSEVDLEDYKYWTLIYNNPDI